jgi:hypothetical protein
MRALPETIAYLRAMIANESVDIMLIDVGELSALCDAAERPDLRCEACKSED